MIPIAEVKNKYAASTALTITLNSLANAASRESTVVDNSTNCYLTGKLFVSVKTHATSAPTGDKACYVYVYGATAAASEFPDRITGTDAAITLDSPANIAMVAAINCPAVNTVYTKVIDLATVFPGGLPPYWGIVVKNSTGFALGSASGAAKFVGVTTQSV